MAFVNGALQDTLVPAIYEISVVSIASRITVREDEWLIWVHRLAADAVEVNGPPVHLQEDAGEGNREVRVGARPTISTP